MMQISLHHFLFVQMVQDHAVRIPYLLVCIESAIGRTRRRERDRFTLRMRQTVSLIELCRLRSRREDGADIRPT